MLMYNLTEYSDNCLKTSGILWFYYRVEPALTATGVIDDFPANSALFKFKQKITDKTENNSTKEVEIMVPLNYLSNFWRTTSMPLIICKINLILKLVCKLCFIRYLCKSSNICNN